MIGKCEARAIMPNVAVSTLLLTSHEWLLETAPEAKGHWLALLGYCTREENGGCIRGAARWASQRWFLALGQGGSREAADMVVGEGLAEWNGDDLIVSHYALDLERQYQQARAAGKKGAEEKRRRKLARLASGSDSEGSRRARLPGSPPGSPPAREPVELGPVERGDVGEGDVSDGEAESSRPTISPSLTPLPERRKRGGK